jgi:hypothetical protein
MEIENRQAHITISIENVSLLSPPLFIAPISRGQVNKLLVLQGKRIIDCIG